MQYSGQIASTFGQTSGKTMYLFPAIGRLVPQVHNSEAKLLDVGCGSGDLYQVLRKKGYQYFGLDLSADLLARAQEQVSEGNFTAGSASHFAHLYTEKFEVVVTSMLLNELSSTEEMIQVLSEMKKVLVSQGKLILGLPHPCFDGYMQQGLFGRSEVATIFKGYNDSGARFATTHELETGPFTFVDYHWTIQDYVACVRGAGLRVDGLDECYPSPELQALDPDLYAQKRKMPKYLVVSCQQ